MVRAREYTQFEPDKPRANQGKQPVGLAVSAANQSMHDASCAPHC